MSFGGKKVGRMMRSSKNLLYCGLHSEEDQMFSLYSISLTSQFNECQRVSTNLRSYVSVLF